jgi:hypothetical protein
LVMAAEQRVRGRVVGLKFYAQWSSTANRL